MTFVKLHIISKEHTCFINRRSIQHCIFLTSKTINPLNKKCFGGDVAINIDISKVFDTLNWKILLKVLNYFGFSRKYCRWIHNILQLVFLSIYINGREMRFFNFQIGVR